MTASFERETAKIFQFPVRGRFAGPGQFTDAKPAALVSSQVAKALSGSWYHEEAIQEALEADRTRKN
jgi:hypothetical protein